jgi:hypothetical protein
MDRALERQEFSMIDEPRIIKSTCAHHPRVDLATRLLTLALADHRLRLALAVCEARQPGYTGALIGHAHNICGSLSSSPFFADQDVVEQAMDAALEWAAPKRILVTPHTEPNEVGEHALLALLEAMVEFHTTSGVFDRRVFPRATDEWTDHLSLEHEISPADWVR